MNLAMSSSRKVSVSFVIGPTVSDQALAGRPGRDQALDDEPVRASRRRMSRIPRWSRNAPIDRKTSSKSCRGLPS